MPLLLILAIETGFRLAGKKPRGSYLKDVPELVVKNNFYADTNGIYKALADYEWEHGESINSDGFRGREFDQPTPGKKRIVIIGDSFGWGYSAKPLSNCFAERIEAAPNYAVFNLSIPGTGPENYALTGRTYIPKIKPDAVLLMVYMGNDINLGFEPTHLEFRDPSKKEWYVTNAGVFSALDNEGNRLSPQEAYNRARTMSVRVINTLRNTAFGTWLVSAVYDMVYGFAVPDDDNRKKVNGAMVECIELIQKTCRKNNAELFVCLIPVNPQMRNTRNSMADNMILFDEFNTEALTFLEFEDYAPFPDDHLNNRGHKKVADHLIKLMNTSLN
jgi:hypothetical protein